MESFASRSSERISGDGKSVEDRDGDDASNAACAWGSLPGLPSLDNTVRGTTRGDGDAVNGEEHNVKVEELSATLLRTVPVHENALVEHVVSSSRPLGYKRGGRALKTDPR